MPRTFCTRWRGGRLWGGQRKNKYRIWYGGKVAEVKATQDQTFFVDVTALRKIENLTWSARRDDDTGKYYFQTTARKGIVWPTKTIFLHRWLLDYTGPLLVDHVDGNPANNTMQNIRLVTHVGNNNNCRLRTANRSGENGIILRPSSTRWKVYYTENDNRCEKTFSQKKGCDEKPARIDEWIAEQRAAGNTEKITVSIRKSKADYLFSWRENTKQCSKTFPATEQGLAKAIKYRAKVYKRIGNQNGKRII